jgi:hypothetical protein
MSHTQTDNWYKVGGIASKSSPTRMVGSLIPILIPVPYTQVAPYMPIQHWFQVSPSVKRWFSLLSEERTDDG